MVACQDVELAFDSMQHARINEALLAIGASSQLVVMQTRELAGVQEQPIFWNTRVGSRVVSKHHSNR